VAPPTSYIAPLSLHDALPIFESNSQKTFSFVSSYFLYLPSMNYRGVYTHCLGERLNGIQEVSGSIPLISTKRPATQVAGLFCLRSEEHTSELQSRFDLVCRLL